jgi:DNA-binding Lrp family transcriptional regulator
MAVLVLDDLDLRLTAALQVDGRASAEKIAGALGVPPRVVARRLASLLRTGAVRVTAVPPRDPRTRISLLRVKVLRGKVNAIAAAPARRSDVPFVDITSTGDEISAIITSSDGTRGRLLFDQFAAADAVTAVTAQTVLRVHAEAHHWRLPVLDERARLDLAPAVPPAGLVPLPADEAEARIREVLQADGRASAATMAARTGVPATTVRRRLHAMGAAGTLLTSVLVDPARLGLHVDANLALTVPPASMNAVAHALTAHPAVHGVKVRPLPVARLCDGCAAGNGRGIPPHRHRLRCWWRGPAREPSVEVSWSHRSARPQDRHDPQGANTVRPRRELKSPIMHNLVLVLVHLDSCARAMLGR